MLSTANVFLQRILKVSNCSILIASRMHKLYNTNRIYSNCVTLRNYYLCTADKPMGKVFLLYKIIYLYFLTFFFFYRDKFSYHIISIAWDCICISIITMVISAEFCFLQNSPLFILLHVLWHTWLIFRAHEPKFVLACSKIYPKLGFSEIK
jgi:hypothetical protein